MTFLDEAAWRGKVCSGGWKQAAGGDAAVTEPATGAELGRACIALPADIAAATAAAAAAQPAWVALPHTERSAILRRAGDSTGIVHINDQTVDDAPNTPFGGIFASGTGARFGGTANLDAFTDTRWVTMRGDIAPYPF